MSYVAQGQDETAAKMAMFEICWKSHGIIFIIVNFASFTQFLCSSIDPGAHLEEAKHC